MPPKPQVSTSRIPIEEEDDERTQISKKITWILRRGAKAVNIDIDDHGWVAIVDLLKYKELADVDEYKLVQVINKSNVKKARYEVSEDGTRIRAYEKKERDRLNKQYGHAYAEQGQPMEPNPGSMPIPSQMPHYPPLGWPPMYNPMMPFVNPFMGVGHGWQQAAQMAAMGSNRYQGRIKSFNSEKGFGFIECLDTYNLYARDVFLHKAQISDMQPGQYVTFTCEVNKQNMPQAKDVQPIGGMPSQPAPGRGAKGGPKGAGKGKKGDGEGKGKSKGDGKSKGEGKGKKKDRAEKKETRDKDNKDKDKEYKSGEEKTGAEAQDEAAEAPKA